jgi:nucleotide-binding universal stress UspA family protein
MYKKLLVASDLTDASDPALAAAINLARALEAKVVVLHVIETPYGAQKWFLPESVEVKALRDIIAKEEQTLHDQLQTKLAALGAEGSHLVDSTIVSQGNPVDEIVVQAEKSGADLIVMGTHGRRGFQHAVMGSVAERVVRMARQAVLTVRASK